MVERGSRGRRSWRDERGSQGLEAAGAALAAALLVIALLAGANTLGPAVKRAYECAAASLTGGAGCATSGQPSAPGGGISSSDKPWWEKLWDGIKDGWSWFSQHVLSPVGDFFKGLWDGLWQEREWTWLKEQFDKLRDLGWFGNILAEVLGFGLDLLVGIDANGKFSIGGVIFALGTTILSFFGVGLLGKIPVLGKLFKGGGVLSRLWAKFAGTKFGAWLTRFGTEGVNDLLKGRWGTIVYEGFDLLKRKLPWLAPLLGRIPGTDIKVLKTLGNYAWRLWKDGPLGLVQDVVKTITKDVLGNPIFKRLYKWKALRDIVEWLQNPTPPWAS